MPINPKSQGSLFADRAISSSRTVGGTLLLTEGARPSAVMQFSGVILDKAQYDTFVDWYEGSHSQRVITVTDHLGRSFKAVFSAFNPSSPEHAKTTPGYAWYQPYEATLTLSSSPTTGTRGDNWEAL